MKSHLPILSAALGLSVLLSSLPVQAGESHADNQDGDLEHYHHEFYSHSYIDPNERDDQGTAAVSKTPHHKNKRHYGKRDSDSDSSVSFAFGGHRRKQR